jgi:hypothetical protein
MKNTAVKNSAKLVLMLKINQISKTLNYIVVKYYLLIIKDETQTFIKLFPIKLRIVKISSSKRQ